MTRTRGIAGGAGNAAAASRPSESAWPGGGRFRNGAERGAFRPPNSGKTPPNAPKTTILVRFDSRSCTVRRINSANPTDGHFPRARDDEYYHEVHAFDCTPWFEQATDEDLVELAACQWRSDYPADQVAEYFQYNNNYPEVVALFAYKNTGFECSVNEKEAVAWLRVHRSHLVHQNLMYQIEFGQDYDIRLPEGKLFV